MQIETVENLRYFVEINATILYFPIYTTTCMNMHTLCENVKN